MKPAKTLKRLRKDQSRTNDTHSKLLLQTRHSLTNTLAMAVGPARTETTINPGKSVQLLVNRLPVRHESSTHDHEGTSAPLRVAWYSNQSRHHTIRQRHPTTIHSRKHDHQDASPYTERNHLQRQNVGVEQPIQHFESLQATQGLVER
jgi:hypothetical protein